MNYIIYSIILASGAAVALFLAYLVARWERHAAGAWVMVAMLVAAAVWSFAYMLELTVAELPIKVLWAKVAYIGIAPIAPIWFIFVFYSVQQRCPLLHRPYQFGLLIIIPVMTLGLAWTNELHGLVWQEIWLDTSGSVPVLNIEYGWWFWVHTAYSYGLLVFGTGWVWLNRRSALALYQRQTSILLLGLLPIISANILYLSDWNPMSGVDPTPLAFLLTSSVYAVGIFRFRMLSFVPLVHQQVVDGLNDPVIAVDLDSRIIHYNLAAQRLIGASPGTLLGRPAAELLGKYGVLPAALPDKLSEPIEIEWDSDPPRYFSVDISPLRQRNTQLVGHLVKLHDVAARRQIEAKLRLLNQTLENRVEERTQDLQNEIAERNRVEMELRANEEKLRYQASLLDIVSDAVISTTPDFQVLTWNRAAQEIYGYSAAEVIGHPLPSYINTEYLHESADQVFRHFMETGFWQGEVFQEHRDGHRIHVWAAVKAIDNQEGQRAGVVAINRDMSAYKQAEQELRESEERYRSLVENTQDLIQSADPKGRFLFVNRSWYDVLGYSEADLAHLTIWKIIAPEEQSHCQSLFAQLKGGAERLSLRTTYITKQGDRLIVEGTATAKYTEGRFAGTYTFLRNVTNSVQAEKAIMAAEARYRGLFEHAPVMYVITHDVDGGPLVVACNQLFCDTLGYSCEDIIGQSLVRFYTRDSRQKLESGGYERALAGTFAAEERELVTKAGTVVNTQLHTSPEKDNAGIIIGTRAMFVDISRRKQVEKRLRETTLRLRKLAQHIEAVREEERTHVAREIHDDLGQMLTALRMDVGWLDRHLVDQDNAIQVKLDSMADLIGVTIKSVQRISSELRPGMLDTLGLAAAAQWQLDQFEERAEIYCVLEADLEDDTLLEPALATVFFRILQEALTNVVRHAQATEVQVKLVWRDDYAHMTIADNGVGMDLAHLDDPQSFGLIGMRERLYPWQGQLDIQSSLHKGTVIDIKVPLKTEAEKPSHD